LEQIWKKIFRPQKTSFFPQTKKEKKEEKKQKLLQSYLNSQSVIMLLEAQIENFAKYTPTA